MSLPWTAIEDGLVTLVAGWTGLSQVAWQDRNQPSVLGSQQAIALLSIVQVGPVGIRDDSVFAEEVPDDNGPLFETTTGWREFTLRVKVEAYDQRPSRHARHYLETMRDKLSWLSSTEALREIGLGYLATLAFLELSSPRDDRIASIAAIDLRLHTFSKTTDPTEYSRIETFETEPDLS